jgi:hypothetical protein
MLAYLMGLLDSRYVNRPWAWVKYETVVLWQRAR